MKILIYKLAIIILIASWGMLFCFPALARTDIFQAGFCQYEIKVKIAFAFKDENAAMLADSLMQKWHEGMENVWNGPAEFGACQIRYLFVFQKVEAQKSCLDYPDYHCISVVSDKNNQRNNIADATLVIADSGQNSWGEWTIYASGLQAAHEAGHMMGLGDEYHYESSLMVNDNIQSNGPQSIMAQTWSDAAALPQHNQKILEQAGYILLASYKMTENQSEEIRGIKFYSSPAGQKVYADRLSEKNLKGALIKGETDPAVYWVDENGELRWVPSEEKARDLFGSDWNSQIIWFSDAIIYTYKIGQPIGS